MLAQRLAKIPFNLMMTSLPCTRAQEGALGKHKFFVGQTVLSYPASLQTFKGASGSASPVFFLWRVSHPSIASKVSWTDTSGLLVRPNSLR